jgi:hypothetical protein
MSNKDFYNQLLEKEESILTKIKEYQNTLESVRDLKRHLEKNQELAEVDSSSNRLGEYDNAWILKDKVHYALKSLVKGTAEEVAEKLLEIDESFNEEKAFRTATHKLSGLYRDKKIDAVKIGKKYRYYIK